MSKKSRPDIDTLLSERTRFEAWLEQLAAKAARMPEHVVARVRADYQGRLDKVVDELRSRADDLRAEVLSLEERLATLAADLEARRDARAEDELRAMVGEYEETAWAEKAAEHDAGIETLEVDRAARDNDLARVRQLLSEATRPSPPVSIEAIAEPPELAMPPEPEPAMESVVPIEELAPEPVVADAPAPVPQPPAPPPAPAEPPLATGRRASPFDEIGFLRTVVGRATPYGGVPQQAVTAAESPPMPVAPGAAAPPPAPPPVAEPVAAAPAPRRSIPTFEPPPFPDASVAAPARASSPAMPSMPAMPMAADPMTVAEAEAEEDARSPRNSQASRSLKCQECGWMNFPTEWYCEKCGGELAAF